MEKTHPSSFLNREGSPAGVARAGGGGGGGALLFKSEGRWFESQLGDGKKNFFLFLSFFKNREMFFSSSIEWGKREKKLISSYVF